MWPKAQKEVRIELTLLDRLVNDYQHLIELVRNAEPDMIERSALAAFLHSFYTGIENIFKRIALEINGSVPAGDRAHSDLLEQMTRPSPNRAPVISREVADRLAGYMRFRHFFRHAYTYLLEWRRMSDLVLNAEETLRQLESELQTFFGSAGQRPG